MDRYDNNYLDDDELVRLERQQQQAPPPSQTVVDEAELLAAQAAAEAAAQQQQHSGGAFNNVGQGLTGRYRDMMMQYWQETINSIEHDDHDFKNHQLPLARIKKVMKTDEDVRMISAEVPILFAKGCDVFITELTMRAWIHAEENKRRTLQKSDIAAALAKSDMFDFLIDVVPREEEKPKKSYSSSRSNSFINSTQHQHQQQQPRTSQPSKIEEEHEQLKQDDNNHIHTQQQDLLQQQLLQQQMLQQQILQQQQQHQQQGSSQPPQSAPPLQERESNQTIPSVNASLNNSNAAGSNFTNFQNFNPTSYEGEF